MSEQPNNTVATKQKKTKESTALKPQHFEMRNGLQRLYEMTKALDISKSSDINVQQTMKKIVVCLKTWQFEMMPKYSFDLFIQRCQVLGNHKRLSAFMNKIRHIHKGEDTWAEEANNAAQDNAPNLEHPVIPQNFKETMNLFSNPEVQPQEDEDEDFMEMMMRMEKKGEKKEQGENFEQPYVPQGFEHNFDENQDD